jgi:hypothetical protein
LSGYCWGKVVGAASATSFTGQAFRSLKIHKSWAPPIKPLLVFLGDFIANVPSADGASNCGQCFSVTRADLVTQHPTDKGTNANSDSTVRCGWFGRAVLLLRWSLGLCR